MANAIQFHMTRCVLSLALFVLASCASDMPMTMGPPGKADGIPIERPADCELSPLAQSILDAMVESGDEGLVPDALIPSYLNDADMALVDGESIYTSLAAEIRGAQQEVDVFSYTWQVSSDPSQTILDAIKERGRTWGDRAEPLRVRLLLNANRLSREKDGSALVDAVRKLELDPKKVRVDVATVSNLALGVMHQKLAVIDGKVAHVGGANIQHHNDWLDRTDWHDTAYIVRGEVAHSMQTAFDQTWSEGETLSCNDSLDCSPFENIWPTRSFFGVQAQGSSCLPMLAITRRPTGVPNNSNDNPQNAGYLAAIAAATDVLKIETPNINDDALLVALQQALSRGVEVRIVTSLGFNEENENLPGQGGGNAETIAGLVDWADNNIIVPCLLRPRWYSHNGSTAVEGNGFGANHTKYMSVDGQLVVIGSTNMDTQSWNFSGEVNVAVDDTMLTQQWDAAVFDTDFDTAIPASECE